MRTIAFVTQKGGSGKSTLASSLAVTAHEAGERVFIFDLDPQQSLAKWSKTRGESDIPVETLNPAKLPTALAAMAKAGVTLCILDTAGAESAATAAAMKAADLNVIPSRPNAFDLWATEQTRKTLRDLGKDYVFLLNQCPPSQQNSRVEEGVKALEAMGGLISPMVSSRVDYQEAARHGYGVSELNPSGQAAEEMRKLWSSIKRRLAKAKPVAASKRAA
jgi:chromosome partitioning protein